MCSPINSKKTNAQSFTATAHLMTNQRNLIVSTGGWGEGIQNVKETIPTSALVLYTFSVFFSFLSRYYNENKLASDYSLRLQLLCYA